MTLNEITLNVHDHKTEKPFLRYKLIFDLIHPDFTCLLLSVDR